MTKKTLKKNNPALPKEEMKAVKRSVGVAFSVAATVLAFAIAITGSIFSFADIDDSGTGNMTRENTDSSVDVHVTEEKMQMLDGFEKAIGELDARISDIETQIEENKKIGTPEKNVYVKELYDEKANLLIQKTEACKKYSDTCISWAHETRIGLADPINEYEKYHLAYRDRLAAVYEKGFPDLSEIFGSSETLMDFVMGKVMLDEIRQYDEELYQKVFELYSLVEDGLSTVKYYLAMAEDYSDTANVSRDQLVQLVSESTLYLGGVCADKDTYNYYLLYCAEQSQRFSAQLVEALGSTAAAKAPELSFPLDSEYFYTDYIGRGHESRYEHSPALDKYVNVFHSGIELLTPKQYAPVKAAADGSVIFASYVPTRGYTVAIAHGKDLVTVYSSCGALCVELGDSVKALDTVAFSGASGDADGFLVNFEVFTVSEKQYTFVDPSKYLEMPDVSVSGN